MQPGQLAAEITRLLARAEFDVVIGVIERRAGAALTGSARERMAEAFERDPVAFSHLVWKSLLRSDPWGLGLFVKVVDEDLEIVSEGIRRNASRRGRTRT